MLAGLLLLSLGFHRFCSVLRSRPTYVHQYEPVTKAKLLSLHELFLFNSIAHSTTPLERGALPSFM